MLVSNVNDSMGNASSVNAQPQPTNNNSQKNPSLEDSFLTMLTAELQNQDPTNPMDSSQMVTQLSQISTAQGIDDLKNLTQTQILTLLGSQRLASSQLIGKSIDYKSDSLTVTDGGGPYSGHLQTDDKTVNTLTLKITDQSGNVVKTMDVVKGADGQYDWVWDGKDLHGNPVAAGTYKVTASSTGDHSQANANVIFKDKVDKVNFNSDGSTVLKLAHGEIISMQNVVSIES